MNNVDQAKQTFKTLYGKDPEVISQAPGRAEIIGNHTDYNSGYALSAAIARKTVTMLARRDDRMIRVASAGYAEEPAEFSLDGMQKGEHGNWLNYIKGVLREIIKVRPDLPGMDILIDSDVPSSGGVSSSAALELSLATGIMHLTGIEMDPVKKAHMCQKAENGDLIGIPCGFLDQASSGLCQKDHLLFLDFQPKGDMPISDMKQIPADLSAYDMTFVVIVDKDVKRNLGTSGYPARRAQCEKSVPILAKMLGKEVSSLRDVSVQEFESCKDKLEETDSEMRMRVEHIVYENQRVLDAVHALENGEMERFGEILTASGKSALELYELDAETPELTKLVTEGRMIEGVIGMRNMGGGFSAIALALVRNDHMDSFQQKLNTSYGPGLEYIPFLPSEGAGIVV
ncbi:galactokinase [Candidatus Roizmanbacteria bacterium]|nr:MAG: galactokinase [Candidatus Roizmanbacteria bacterium]